MDETGKKKKHHQKRHHNTGEEIPYGQHGHKGKKQKHKTDKQGRRIDAGVNSAGVGLSLLEHLKQKFSLSKQKLEEKFHDPEAYPDPYSNVQNTDIDKTR